MVHISKNNLFEKLHKNAKCNRWHYARYHYFCLTSFTPGSRLEVIPQSQVQVLVLQVLSPKPLVLKPKYLCFKSKSNHPANASSTK
jgi:hypothetical protein